MKAHNNVFYGSNEGKLNDGVDCVFRAEFRWHLLKRGRVGMERKKRELTDGNRNNERVFSWVFDREKFISLILCLNISWDFFLSDVKITISYKRRSFGKKILSQWKLNLIHLLSISVVECWHFKASVKTILISISNVVRGNSIVQVYFK